MAPASPAASDAASDIGRSPKRSPTKAKKAETPVEDSEKSEAGGDAAEAGDEEEEEEYEIEAILDAQKGHFPNNKLGYLVKWKNYSDEHNSWVVEEDAGNAEELIDAYWAEHNKKKSKKQPEARRVSAPARKSTGADDASDAGASASVAKKRGRNSSVKARDGKDDERPPAKKPRKSAAAEKEKKTAEVLDEDSIGNMEEHMHVPSWEHLIKEVDTVERDSEGGKDNTVLWVYFTLHSGERIREDADVCHDKFPKLLLRFYERNLRWKST
ncbi:hypothetical protein B0H15DRAFT_779516 [Mycena belliarum]|uniref:Chromo domain-containing protein n=1 Tax=Mycena belliarum TaxID=1033014 RepID=A0AAD6XSK4_9AGAR|nr:hypothetical protein B0H15DRAFT_779516 [Mycena belliae]